MELAQEEKRITWRRFLRLFPGPRAWKSIGKRFQPIAEPPVLYFVTLFSLSFAIAFDAYGSGIFPQLDCANHIGSQQDENRFFPGKVFTATKNCNGKQNIHNAARLRRKWFPKKPDGFFSASTCNFPEEKTLRQKSLRWFSCWFQGNLLNLLQTFFQQLGLWLSWTWIVVIYCTSISACSFTYSSRSPSSSWHDGNYDEVHAWMIVAVLNSLFRGFHGKDHEDCLIGVICVGHLWCSALQKLLARVRSGGVLVLHWNHPDFMAFCLCFHRSSQTKDTHLLHVLQWPPLQYVFTLHGHPVTVVFFTLHGGHVSLGQRDNNEFQVVLSYFQAVLPVWSN